MKKFTNSLDNIYIASPCKADWNAMVGDERRRYCGECKLNVYNLSGMNRTEAENLIQTSEGRLCVRFYKRSDGSVITQDCPVGWARVKQRTKIFVTAAASLIFSFLGAFGLQAMFSNSKVLGVNLPIPFVTPTPERLMGTVAPDKNNDKNNDKTRYPVMGTPTPKRSPTPKATPQNPPLMGIMAPPRKEEKKVLMGEVNVKNN